MSDIVQKDMTAPDFAKAILTLERSIGKQCRVSVFLLSEAEHPLMCAVYPNGGYTSEFTISADTFAELLNLTTQKWAEYEDTYKTRTIRKMALAIIRITSEIGHCTDAALRACGEFDPGQVKTFGERACADANEIAGKGPFSIVVMGGANSEAA